MTRKVLITGAAGRVGSYLASRWANLYDLVLTDIRQPADTYGVPFILADLADLPAMEAACQGVDTVVHMGANPGVLAPWEDLLGPNVLGVYHVFEAARRAGCRRVIFASSIQAVSDYPDDVQVHAFMPPRPRTLYGASKVWGEAVANAFSCQHGLSAICLRFGAIMPHDFVGVGPGRGSADIVLTLRDLEKLVRAAIEAPDTLRYGVFHALSDNRWKRLDIEETRRVLGYEPEDDGFEMAARGQTGS